MAGPYLEVDLGREIGQLHRESPWQGGQNARTLVKFDDFRVVLTALKAGERIAEHKTRGRVTIHLLTGHVRLAARGRTFDLRPGSLLALDRETPHELEALEDSAFLLTLAWPGPA
jgi:quercetin dioxygenase-like cupin family protein